MNVYFACSITGGREFEETYQAIVRGLLEDGHHVPTSFLATAEVIGMERIVSPQDVYARDVAWIDGCDALVAEVSTPSHGVGYEIAYALSRGKPVLCCYQDGRQVSKMITGNSHPNIQVLSYHSVDEAVQSVRGFLKVTGLGGNNQKL